MRNCREVDQIMAAYVDGEVDATTSAAVDTHLRECPPCRERASVEAAARGLVRRRAATLGAEAPAALRARCVAAAPTGASTTRQTPTARWRAGWVPLSMAATVLLAIGAVFLFGQNQRLEAAFAAQLALDHERCFTVPGDPAGLDHEQAQLRMASDHGLDVTVPAESADFDVVDVRGCQYDGGPMVHVLCQWRGQPVSLFVVPDRSGRERTLEVVDHDALIWSHNNRAYVLVAEHGPVQIFDVAAYVRRYTDQ